MAGSETFRRIRRNSRLLWVDPAWQEAALALRLLEPGRVEALLAAGTGESGRAPTAVLDVPGRRERLLLREVLHGGWLGGWLGDRLLGPGRPLAELEATARLRAAGAPVPTPVLAVARRRLGPVWSAAVGTVFEEHGVAAHHFLAARPEPPRLLAAAAAVGTAVRRLHDAGGRHPDLHLGNVLVREGEGRAGATLVDLDRARVVERVDSRAAMAELMRLYRSLVKRDLLDVVGARGCAHFLSAYTGGDRALRRALRAHLPRELRRLARHRLLY